MLEGLELFLGIQIAPLLYKIQGLNIYCFLQMHLLAKIFGNTKTFSTRLSEMRQYYSNARTLMNTQAAKDEKVFWSVYESKRCVSKCIKLATYLIYSSVENNLQKFLKNCCLNESGGVVQHVLRTEPTSY